MKAKILDNSNNCDLLNLTTYSQHNDFFDSGTGVSGIRTIGDTPSLELVVLKLMLVDHGILSVMMAGHLLKLM